MSFDWVIFYSFLDSLDWNVFSDDVLEDLGDVFCLILNGVIIGHETFMRYLNYLSHFFIFDVASLIWNVSKMK